MNIFIFFKGVIGVEGIFIFVVKLVDLGNVFESFKWNLKCIFL